MDIFYFGKTETRVGRYSLVVLFWGLLPEVNIILGALREAFLPKLQVLLLPEPLLIPAGFALRKLPFSPTKLDTPLSQLSFGCGKLRYLYLYKGEPQWSGF